MHASFKRNKYILYWESFYERNIKISDYPDNILIISLDISARKGNPIES